MEPVGQRQPCDAAPRDEHTHDPYLSSCQPPAFQPMLKRYAETDWSMVAYNAPADLSMTNRSAFHSIGSEGSRDFLVSGYLHAEKGE